MKTVLSFVAVAALMAFSSCESKEAQETPVSTSEGMEEATHATDVAETTAAPIDTAGFSKDSLATNI